MAYILLPITGTGTENDPFRPAIPAAVLALPGLKWSAHIPSNPDGTPRFANCHVWIPDSIVLPGTVTIIARDTARSAIIGRDGRVNPKDMEMR